MRDVVKRRHISIYLSKMPESTVDSPFLLLGLDRKWLNCDVGPATGQTEEDQRQTSNSARTGTLEGEHMVRWTQLFD